ncbi:MAG: hypothetical protein LBM21_02830 [Coriobacteriales bacterium]|jgi:predicted nucleic-acid-binding protein|nr:hypothetical protein [Coriobacteriales bacterium]
MATYIDETVILRYLLDDNHAQAQKAARTIREGHTYSSPEIMARVAVTLRDIYKCPRSLIANAVEMLCDDIIVIEEDVCRLAGRFFGSTLYDFTDCLMLARNALYGYDILSFDKPILKRTI